LPRIWENLPADWLHADADTSLPPALQREFIERTLNRFRHDPKAFWEMRP